MKWAAIFVVAILAGCGERGALEERGEAESWNQWARGVEARYPVSDADGHGPDIGSDEWARALQQRLGVVDADGHGPDIGSAEWRQAVEEKLPD
jgi:hypothetical protein